MHRIADEANGLVITIAACRFHRDDLRSVNLRATAWLVRLNAGLGIPNPVSLKLLGVKKQNVINLQVEVAERIKICR